MKKVLFVVAMMAFMLPMIAGAQTKALYHEFETRTECESFTWDNGETYTTDTVAFRISGDTLYVLDLEIRHAANYDVAVSTGCMYLWGDSTYTESTVDTRTFTDRFGCDSIVTLTLTVEDTLRDLLDTSVCRSFTWRGHTFTVDTFLVDTVEADIEAGVCAALHTLNLEIKSYGNGAAVDTNACKLLAWHDSTYTADASFSDTVRYTAAGVCDSVFDVTIHITTPENGTVNDTTITNCNYAQFSFGSGNTFTTEETIDTSKVTLVTTDGQCIENTLRIHLVVNKNKYIPIDTSSCGVFVFNEKTYSENTIDTVKVGKTSEKCDSNVVLDLTVYNEITVTISGDLDLLPGSSTTLTGNCNQSDATMSWNYNGQSSSESSVTLTNLNENTDVSLTVTSADQNCSRTAYVTIMVSEYFTGIEDVTNGDVKLYPNPAATLLNISCPQTVETVTVYNMAGQKIDEQRVAADQFTMDVAGYYNGVYMVSLKMSDGTTVNQKVAVRK